MRCHPGRVGRFRLVPFCRTICIDDVFGKVTFTCHSPSCREDSFSEIGGSKPATRIPADGGLSSGTTCFCCLLPGYSHTCCEGLLRGATAGCSRVAGELVLCSQERRCAPQTTQDYRSSHAGAQCFGHHTTTLHSKANVSRLNSPILRYCNRNSLGASG